MVRKRGLFAHIAICKGIQLINAINCLVTLLVTSLKGKFGANQASCNSVNGADKAIVVTNQCPISKTQCEQLLAFLNSGSTNSGASFGDASHVASVSSSCMYTGVEGLIGMASDVVGTFASPNLNTNAAFMSSINFNIPFLPSLKHSVFSVNIVDRNAFNNSDRVIDIGATNHMVHSLSCFTTVTAIVNTFVNLPNGETALVTHVGTIRISENLILTNVLCVPSFSFNLLSVSQLSKTTLCCLIFFGNMCFI